jgi:hypothetical protein
MRNLLLCRTSSNRQPAAGTHKLLKTYTKKKPNTDTPQQVERLIEASTDDSKYPPAEPGAL